MALAMTLTAISAASGQVADFDWATIGAPGNRPTQPHEVPWQPGLQVGSVPYEYRITRTEVTVSQYIDFVRAYAPYWEGPPGAIALTGSMIYWRPERGYYIHAGEENFATNATWPMAARFCNWLHNGRASDLAAFETGVYDMASGARERLPGATYWLPTEDEWLKAGYYDPDRYGPGEEGYWLYPNRGNDPLIRGLPEDGGETNAGLLGAWMPVGQYPNAASPWGLLDLSGGESEWFETYVDVQGGHFRAYRGSWNGGTPGDVDDRLDTSGYYSFASSRLGVRLGSTIPTPSTAGAAILWAMLLVKRRGR